MALRFDLITLFPEMITQGLNHGVVGQAYHKNLFEVCLHNPRSVTSDVHKTVDDRPYGGGDGMVMLAEPLEKTFHQIKSDLTILFSPQGRKLNADLAKELSGRSQLTLISARYGGVDQRFINRYVDLEVSIGDYVLSGGELPALVFIDSVVRFLPGVLGHVASPYKDSFESGLLEAPLFTRPREILDQRVPDILLGGNHLAIKEWTELVSWLVTLQKREDLFRRKINGMDERSRFELLKNLKLFFKGLSFNDKKVLSIQLSEADLEKYE